MALHRRLSYLVHEGEERELFVDKQVEGGALRTALRKYALEQHHAAPAARYGNLVQLSFCDVVKVRHLHEILADAPFAEAAGE